MLVVLSEISESTRRDIVITGKEGSYYPEGKVHAIGYALDFRAGWPQDRSLVEQVQEMLTCYSRHFKVLFGPPDHLNHAHIGFSWWFAQDGEAPDASTLKELNQITEKAQMSLFGEA